MLYHVYNETRDRWLGDRILQADTPWSRFRGLMGRAALHPGEGLHLLPCNGIHMAFMRFPIDALFLDRDGEVIALYQRLRPFRMTRPWRHARSVLELPAGTADATGTRVGDRLRIGR